MEGQQGTKSPWTQGVELLLLHWTCSHEIRKGLCKPQAQCCCQRCTLLPLTRAHHRTCGLGSLL